MSKTLIVCADGTAQQPSLTKETNVFKLYRLFSEDSSQKLFYDAGVGIDAWPLLGRAVGLGISKNILDGYKFLIENYAPGDRVVLVGYSRGAFTVRSLGGLIARCGILQRKFTYIAGRALAAYRSRVSHTQARVHETYAVPGSESSVYSVACFDTVSALGFPWEAIDRIVRSVSPCTHTFHDTRLGSSVKRAYHAISIDDDRRVFHPTLWNEEKVAADQVVKQAWFPGSHADVGGGFEDRGLADVSLQWMLVNLAADGLRFVPDWDQELSPDPMDQLHPARSGWGKLYTKKVRDIAALCEAEGVTPVAHSSMSERVGRSAGDYFPENFPGLVRPDKGTLS